MSYVETSALTQCPVVYQHTRKGSTGTVSCQAPLPPPGSNRLGLSDVRAALSTQDVSAAFSSGVVLFGSDPRGCDGSVLDVTYLGHTIEVGGDCSQAGSCGGPATGCVPVPPALAKFAELLQQIDKQELATPACASLR